VQESNFKDLAEAAGLAVVEVDLSRALPGQLEEYTEGQYQVLQLAWRDPASI
jgi:hypothetical protein